MASKSETEQNPLLHSMHPMKFYPFPRRLQFAWAGVKLVWREPSFKVHLLFAVSALALLAATEASAIWWALFLLIIGAVLVAELFNTALEYLSDAVHPQRHPLIQGAKDCAAGAVLIASLVSLGIFVAFVISQLS